VVIGTFVSSLPLANWTIMAMILLVYFLMGMVMDLMSMMIITMPIFFPIVCETLGYDPLWFGVILTILIMLGGLTPRSAIRCLS
jgi:TRAP-type C4-dicarboxylate transport system permease large subunit